MSAGAAKWRMRCQAQSRSHRSARLAELFGRERVDDAGLEAGGGEGVLNGAMVTAGPLDGDHEVAQVVVAAGPAELIDGGVEGGAVVREQRGGHQDVAVEIGEHPLGAGLGAIDRDDAEVFGTDLLDARMKSAAGLLNNVGASRTGAMTGARTGHRDCLRTGVRATQFSQRQSGCFFFLSENQHTRGRLNDARLALLPDNRRLLVASGHLL